MYSTLILPLQHNLVVPTVVHCRPWLQTSLIHMALAGIPLGHSLGTAAIGQQYPVLVSQVNPRLQVFLGLMQAAIALLTPSAHKGVCLLILSSKSSKIHMSITYQFFYYFNILTCHYKAETSRKQNCIKHVHYSVCTGKFTVSEVGDSPRHCCDQLSQLLLSIRT